MVKQESKISNDRIKLPEILSIYENSDYALKLRVKFVYNYCLLVIACILAITIYSAIIQVNVDTYKGGVYLPIILPLLGMLGLMLVCIFLLIKGYYSISIHTILTSTILTVWAVMWLDKGNAISILDTASFVIAILSILPLLIIRNKKAFIIYPTVNLLVLVIFIIYTKNRIGLSNSTAIEFIADTSLSIILVSILSYSIFSINKRTIERTITDINERNIAEQRLRESDEAYRYMFNMNPQPMLIYKLDDLSILEVNNSSINHYGYSKDEFLSFTLKDIRPKEDIQSLLDDIKDINNIYSKKGYSRHIKKNGDIIYVETSAHSITYKDCNARHVLINDITERIETELALAESEKKFREMADLLPQVIFEANLEGKLTYVNKKAYETFEFNETDLQNGVNILSTIVEGDRARAIENVKLTISGNNTLGNQYTALRKDGTTFPIQIYSSNIKEKERIVGLRGIIIDITERIKSEQELKTSRDQFQSLVSNIPGITYRCLNDKDWTMLYISSEVDKISGYHSEDFINNKNRTYSSIIHPDDSPNISKEVEYAINESRAWEVEYRILHKDGNIRWAYEKGRAIKNTLGEISYLDGFILDITERKAMNEMLKSSELRYKTLIETSQDGISLMDLNGNMLFVNHRKAEMVKAISEESLIGTSAFLLLSEKSRASMVEVMPTILEKGYLDNLEAEVLRLDGSTFNAEFNVTVLKDENGNPLYLMDTMRDITERKKTELAIRESEELFKTLIDLAPIAITLTDINGRFILANKTFLDDTKYHSDEVIGKSPRELGISIDEKMEEFMKNELSQKGYFENIELSYNNKFGNKVYFYHSARIIQLNNQYVTLGTSLDFTERKNNEIELENYRNHLEMLVNERTEELAAANEELRATNEELYDLQVALLNEKKLIDELMETIPDAIYFKDCDSRFIKVSKSMYNFTGSRKEIDLIGKTDFDLFTKEHAQPAYDAEQEIIKTGQPIINLIEKETWIDGKISYASTTKMPLKDVNGNIIGTFGISHDITKLVEMEEEIRKQNEKLIQQQKHLELTLSELKKIQNDLIQSEKMASLGILAAGVAHEINNPLNFIYGGIAGIESYIKDTLPEHLEEVAPLINGIQIGVKRAADIVTSLNHYSRKDDLPNTICDIHSIIENCLVMLNNKIKNKVTIVKKYTSDKFTILCNEGRLHQVFLNILVNSIQAIENSGTITIFTEVKNNRVYIKISDTGCGISSDILPKITDPFFTTKDPGQGTGLGLSITYNIINEYNGSLSFESKVGVGTDALVSLPIKA